MSCVMMSVQIAELELRLDVKCEECDTLTSDLERANVRLSEIDGQTATVVEKVGDRCNLCVMS